MAKVGRPLKYGTVEQLEKAINEYFDTCDNRVQQIYSKKSDGVIEVINPEPYTIAGLVYALGFDSRQSLLNYSEKGEFLDTIRKAKVRVQLDVERRLMETQPTGAIFNLKNNFGYADKTEVEHSGEVSSKLTKEEYDAIIARASKTGRDTKT